MKDQHILTFNSINNNVVTNRESSQSWPQVLISPPAQKGTLGEQENPIGNVVNQPVCDLDATAFLGHVIPNAIQFGFGFWSQSVLAHYPL